MFGIDDALMIGGSLLSGIFGSKKKKETTTINYSEMAASAEAAGFNPLTVLRNGGSAGFTTTVSHPGLSAMGDAISAIGGHLGTKLNQKVDPIEAKRQKVDDLLLDYQLAALQSQKKPAFGGVPQLPTPTTHVQKSPGLSTKRAPDGPNKPGEGTIVGGDNPTVSTFGWNNGRYGYFHAPWMPDAEINEKINGDNELASTVYSVGKYINDWGYSGYRNFSSFNEDVIQPGLTKLRKRRKQSEKAPISAHQADPGSWLDFAPSTNW